MYSFICVSCAINNKPLITAKCVKNAFHTLGYYVAVCSIFLYKMNNALLYTHIAHRGFKIASEFYLGFVREFE
jgi:hypothetical protein